MMGEEQLVCGTREVQERRSAELNAANRSSKIRPPGFSSEGISDFYSHSGRWECDGEDS